VTFGGTVVGKEDGGSAVPTSGDRRARRWGLASAHDEQRSGEATRAETNHYAEWRLEDSRGGGELAKSAGYLRKERKGSEMTYSMNESAEEHPQRNFGNGRFEFSRQTKRKGRPAISSANWPGGT